MSYLDDLKRQLGMSDGPVQGMLMAEPPPPPELDQQVLAATSGDMSQPIDNGAAAGGENLGHPDVLSFLKELDQTGQLTASDNAAPKAPRGMVGAQTTIKGEQGGPPPSFMAQDVAVRGQADLNDAEVDRQRLLKDHEETTQRAAYLHQDAQIETMKRQEQEQDLEKRQQRLRDQQLELAQQNDEPINPNRYYENKSLAGKAASIVSAAIYGYLGGRGQPPVMESLMQMAQADVQAQLANNAQARGKRNTLIEQYERQYGDTSLVAKRLEADKLLTMAKEAKAQALDAKSTEAKAQAEDLGKKLENQVGRIHSDIQKATYGKPLETSTTFVTPKPKGSGDGIKEALALREAMEKGGYSQEAIAAELKKRGINAPTGPSAFRAEEDRKTRDQDIQEGKANQLPPEAQKDLRDRTDGLAASMQAMGEFDGAVGFKRNAEGEVMAADESKLDSSTQSVLGQVAGAAARSLPFNMDKGASEFVQKTKPEDNKALERIRDRIVFGQAKAEGAGALGDAERESYRGRIPTDSPLSIQRSSAEAWRAQRQQYRNLVGQYGKEATDEYLRAKGIDPSKLGGE